MILVWLILIPLIGALWISIAGLRTAKTVPWIAAFSVVTTAACLVAARPCTCGVLPPGYWLQFNLPWIPAFGISFHLGLDGLSYVLLCLSAGMTLLAIFFACKQQQERVPFFYMSLLLMFAGVNAIFLAIDLFLFFVAWELVLIPLLMMTMAFGGDNKKTAALRFFIFTQASGLCLLVSIVALSLVHFAQTGVHTFDYRELAQTLMGSEVAFGIALGFVIAFAVKLPVFPFHGWLPGLMKESPVSALLIGILIKTGAYGFLRFALPMFPDAIAQMSTLMMVCGAIGVFYGALLAFSQNDVRLVLAYSTISHMGFVVIGLFSQQLVAQEGIVVLMIAQALSTGGMLMLFGQMRVSVGFDLNRTSGLFTKAPRAGALFIMLTMASVGVPGFFNFIGEFLVLVGSYATSHIFAAIAAIGLIVGAIYGLWLMSRAFFGKPSQFVQAEDLSLSSMAPYVVMIGILIGVGVYPNYVLKKLSLNQPFVLNQPSFEEAPKPSMNGDEQ